MYIQILKGLLFPLLFLLFACDQEAESRLLKIDELMQTLSEQEQFNGNILIAEKGKIIYEKSLGFADYDKKIPLTSDRLFNIASVSKTFTAVLIMILEERKLLDLDDNITKYLPELPYKDIKIRNLLTHTSGLPLIQRQPLKKALEGKGFDNRQVLALFEKRKPQLQFSPGSDFLYANTNFLFLALIVEEVSGKSFPEFLDENVFKELNMNDTFLKEKRVPAGRKDRIVSYYRRPTWLTSDFQHIDTLHENIEDLRTYGNNYGESAIYTTTRDLLKFHFALQNHTLLSKASLEKMYAPFKMNTQKAYRINVESNYPAVSGLCWRVAKDSSQGKIVFHSGGFRGGRSFFVRNLEKDQCIIMLTNNEETDRYNFTSPMRILNNESYTSDPISLARVFAKELSIHGIEKARRKYHDLKEQPGFKPMSDWDFEEIGSELLEKNRIADAVGHYALYTETFPDKYSYALLGEAYLLNGNKAKAKLCFEQSLEFDPEYADAKKALEKMEN